MLMHDFNDIRCDTVVLLFLYRMKLKAEVACMTKRKYPTHLT